MYDGEVGPGEKGSFTREGVIKQVFLSYSEGGFPNGPECLQ